MPDHNVSSSFTNTNATVVDTASTLTSMVAFLPSFSASVASDFFSLFIICVALATARQLWSFLHLRIVDLFFVTASFANDDDTYQWVTFWLSSTPEWRQLRDFSVTTGTEEGDLQVVVGPITPGTFARQNQNRPIRYLPNYYTSYRMWYRQYWMTISRVKESDAPRPFDKSTLTISILSRNRSVMDALILEAKQMWLNAHSNKIDIFAVDKQTMGWRSAISQPKRPFNTIVLDRGVKEHILTDAREFLSSKEWYAKRGIPFRRGYLFHGTPGSGKTSLIHSLAGELGLDIFVISLSTYNLDDTSLGRLVSNLPSECVAVIEDIDVALARGTTRGSAGMQHRDPQSDPDDPLERKDTDPMNLRFGVNDTGITLSGLLNALDGVVAREGRLLFATTNRRSALDPALLRPGRMDVHVEFHLASKNQAREMFTRFYAPDVPGAQLGSTDTGEDSVRSLLVDEKRSRTGTELIDLETDSCDPSSTDDCTDVTDIATLAKRFADSIPERMFSMASLQCYLMAYKMHPVHAVEGVSGWVNERLAEHAPGETKAWNGGHDSEIVPVENVSAAAAVDGVKSTDKSIH